MPALHPFRTKPGAQEQQGWALQSQLPQGDRAEIFRQRWERHRDPRNASHQIKTLSLMALATSETNKSPKTGYETVI